MRPPVGQPFFLEDPPGVETAMVSKPAGATEDLVFTALGFRISRLLRLCALAIINSCDYWLVIRDHDMLGAGSLSPLSLGRTRGQEYGRQSGWVSSYPSVELR